MPEVSVSDFKSAYPEFATADQGRVSAHLEEAEADTSKAVFGDRWRRAVMLLAAHGLDMERTTSTAVPFAADPMAQGASGQTRRSPYLAERELIAKRRVIGVVIS